MSEYIINQIAAASVPNAPVGSFTLFLDTDGIWKKKDENGVVSAVSEAETQGLPDVLGLNNTTGANDIIVSNDQVIKSENGNSAINLRNFGIDDRIKISSGEVEVFWNGTSFEVNAGSIATQAAFGRISLSPIASGFTLTKSDFTKFGDFNVFNNDSADYNTVNLPNFPASISSQNATLKAGVVNSTSVSGKDIIVKTNDTLYSNKKGYNTGTAGELIVQHTPSATDRTQTHQDADGTIALLDDIPLTETNRIIVTPSNVGTTLGGTIDSTKEYFLDGIIDLGTIEITVPADGINIKGYDFNLSALVSTENNYTMFKSDVGGSGDVLMTDLYIQASGTSSKVYDLTDSNGFHAIEVNKINYIACTSLGELNGYRQGLEIGTGRFSGSPSLTLSGTWLGGFRITTSIVRGLSSSMTTPLFAAGTGFVMNSRFLTDINVDLPALASFSDFAPSNFTNPSTLQVIGAIVTRNGVSDSTDSNYFTAITEKDLASSWQNNQGLPNTFVGGRNTITSENLTVIGAGSTFYDLNAIWTASELQHFDTPSSNQLRHLGNNPKEFKVICDVIIEGPANNDLTLRISKYDASSGTTSVVVDQRRQINSLVGGRDVAFFNINDNVTLEQNDYIFLRVANNSGNGDVTAENTSYFIVEER
jgi:hypothetical protein